MHLVLIVFANFLVDYSHPADFSKQTLTVDLTLLIISRQHEGWNPSPTLS